MINLKPIVPSVSPLESEASDSEDESSIFSPQLFNKIRPMPPLPNNPVMASNFDPFAPNFEETREEHVKGGDVLFFEGKPFRYLEHLDSLPPPPPSLAQKPKQVQPNYTVPRDSLQSLMRVDPQALMGAATFNFRQVP